MTPRRYALGHSERELERLVFQAQLIDPITRRFLREAGLEPGMRVLDVGSGAGHVAFVVAEIVGDTGLVIGVDRAAAAQAEATAQGASRSVRNISFHQGDPIEMAFDEPFDAVVGRYVLMFQPNPAAMLHGLAAKVRPGGIVVFHEMDLTRTASLPPAPTYDRCCRWIAHPLRESNSDLRLGIKLHRVFTEAGLAPPEMRMEALIAGGAQSRDLVHLVAETTGSLIPDLEAHGIATAAEVGFDTLEDRIMAEVMSAGSVLVWKSEIAAWSRVRGGTN